MNISQMNNLTLSLLPDPYAVGRFPRITPIPAYAFEASFFSINQTVDELSVVCDQSVVPADVKKTDNWRAFIIEGPLDFSQVGILSSLAQPLAENHIPIFIISIYDTDYFINSG